MDNNNCCNGKPRKRSLTELTLGWLAEKMRRSEQIKEQVQSGTFKVDSAKVAEAMLNKE